MSSPPLFDFKAGRVELNDKTGQATPLAGQGRVTLLRSSEDPSLLGIQWLPRGSNSNASASEELLLVPGDVEFSHLPQCQTGRVIQMRFHSSGERHLFWLQDAPKGDLHVFSSEDENILAKLNELANDVNEEESDEDTMHDNATEQTPLVDESLSKDSHIQAVTEPEHSTSSPEGDTNSESAQDALYQELRARLSGNWTAEQQQQSLSQFVSSAERSNHIKSASETQLQDLLKHTNGVASNREELIEVIQSPQFAQSLDQLGRAVMESPALAQALGLSKVPRTNKEFIEELQKAATKK